MKFTGPVPAGTGTCSTLRVSPANCTTASLGGRWPWMAMRMVTARPGTADVAGFDLKRGAVERGDFAKGWKRRAALLVN